MEGLERIVREHPFFAGLAEDFLDLVVGCAKNVRFEAGAFLLREGGPADWLYLLRHGRVSLEVTIPGRDALSLMTLGEGEIVGLSWLVPPYRGAFDARALGLVRAVAIDAGCLRAKCEADHDLGYDVMKRFLPVLSQRLQATRLQLLDLYGGDAG